jgi:hypothetical protein
MSSPAFRGEGLNPLVRENVDMLGQRYADRLIPTVSTVPDADSGKPPKSFRPQRMLELETRTDLAPAGVGKAPLEADARADVESEEDQWKDDDETSKDRRFVPRKASAAVWMNDQIGADSGLAASGFATKNADVHHLEARQAYPSSS